MNILSTSSARLKQAGAASLLLVLCVRAALAHDDLTQLDLSTLMQMDITLVTAQRRSEDVTQVPVSINVLKADDIGRGNLVSTVDLQSVVPGLTTTNVVGLILPHIRGVGAQNNASIEPSVSVYVDEVLQAARSQTFVDFANVEQIEVLRGPQGTLYGRNTTAGAINITTRGPTASWVGDAEVTAGNLNLRDGRMFVAGPVHEQVRVSFSSHVRERAGYYENILGLPVGDSENFYSLHARAQFDVASNVEGEVLLKYFHRNDSVNAASEISGNSLPALLGAPVATQPFTSASDLTDAPNEITNRSAALKLNWNAPWATVRSITAYGDIFQRSAYDLDTSGAPLIHVFNRGPSRALTQELQFSPAVSSDRVDWLAGAFFIDSSTGFDPLAIETAGPGGPLTRVAEGDLQTRAFAAFGEATVHLDDRLSVTGGLRYSNERKRLEDSAGGVRGAPLLSYPTLVKSWDDVSYRLIAKYALAHSLLYAKTETGFKSGSFNAYNPERPGPIGPETITAYEVGAKHALDGLPIKLATAAFFNDIRDLQLLLVDQSGSSQVFASAPRSRTYGIDASIEWQVGRHWIVSTGVSWLEAQYDTFVAESVQVRSPAGGHVALPMTNLAGRQLPRSPRFSGNVSVACDYPVGPGVIQSALNYYRSSRMYFDPANEYSQRDFGVLNANIGYRANRGWIVSAWAKNLTDATYLSAVVPTQINALGQHAEPRTYGMSVGYAFGK